MPPVKIKGVQKPRDIKKVIFRLFGYMGGFKMLWLLVAVCVICSAFASAAASYMIKPALNNFILPLIGHENPDFSALLSMLQTLALIFILGAFATWSNSRLMLHISSTLIFKIRTDLQKKTAFASSAFPR